MRRLFTTVLVMGICASAHGKNVILFVGDGMGISTVTAGRIFAGQQMGKDGEEHNLSFDAFPHVALVKTYNVDAQVADSAGTITAMLSGQKTRMGVLGINAVPERGDCAAALDAEIPSILELAEEAGKSTGVVSTARITHATPAGAYAHTPDRNWENSSTMPAEARAAGCKDIALQMLEMPHGDGMEVILGGGRAQFMPRVSQDPEYPDQTGLRDDGRHLIGEWQRGRKGRSYVWNAEQLQALDANGSDQVLGLFEPSHLQFEADREKDPGGEPSLAEMTRFALKRLAQNENGYFLLVEAGRIDHAHHFGNAYRALVDTVALDEAVAAALDMVDLAETQIIVTADHSHTFTISGYPPRGNPILGKVDQRGSRLFPESAKKPYTTLGYANGPGYKSPYPDLTEVDTQDPNYQQIAAVPMPVETHAGEDVAAFATGLHARKVAGVMEQSRLFDAMTAALFDTQASKGK